jgi:hypothetical protein
MFSELQFGVDLARACPEGGVLSGPTSLLPHLPIIQVTGAANIILSVPYTHNTHNLTVVPRNNVRVLNRDWSSGVDGLVSDVMTSMRCHMFDVSVQLNRLEVQDSGKKLKQHQQLQTEHPRKFATLVIQAPSVYSGGKVCVDDLGESESESGRVVECDLGHQDAGIEGVELQKSVFSYYYVCFFQGKQMIQEEIKSGSRILIYYDLLWNEKVSVPRSVGSLEESTFMCMRNALLDWRMEEKMVLYPFDNLYSDVPPEDSDESEKFKSGKDFFADEINSGMKLDNLVGFDRRVAKLFDRIARDCDFQVYLVACYKRESHSSKISSDTYSMEAYRGRRYRDRDNNNLKKYLDSLVWTLDRTLKSSITTFFEMNGRRLPFEGDLSIVKLQSNGLGILNPGKMDSLFSKKSTLFSYSEYPPRRIISYEGYALLVIPTCNLFEVFLKNGCLDYAICLFETLSEDQVITILSWLDNEESSYHRIDSQLLQLFQSPSFLNCLKQKSLIAPFLDIILHVGSFWNNFLLKEESGLFRILIELLGIDNVYDWILMEKMYFSTDVDKFLKFLISSGFFIRDKFCAIINAYSQNWLRHIIDSREIDQLDPDSDDLSDKLDGDDLEMLDFLFFYCTDKDANSKFLKFLSDNFNTPKYMKILMHFRSKYSYKDFVKSDLLQKVLDEQLSFLKLEVSQIPKFSWKICTNRFPVNDNRLKEFYSSVRKTWTIKFDGVDECRNYIYGNNFEFVECKGRVYADESADLVLVKNGNHFQKLKEIHQNYSEELDGWLAWMAIDKETFLQSKKRISTAKKSALEKKRKVLEN